ncbi:unnamed protein product [Rotaria magnacalcarata]|uniref:Transmembrane protein 26 n=3 Tax=Rotaria magnacalcarata TaxID=392030 RepID=A0A816GID3_9BILA|nr:unnamed protein product [Rotaria magnacalcarata]CAF1673786.1 unnamed protein product [Rotaria magnacalcarata]CAF1923252.1 unnamed protein product [Rotaria magnacalcarata]CAF3847914.1 unnamed protein product [Rotaria magnacalcarata]CAF4100731.1 unnamed protein product [Rotaria magnacalcarata]
MSKTEETLRQCGRWICHSIDILKATIMRVIFALHATIAIVRIVVTKGDYWYLLNMCGVNFLLIELIITIVKRKGKEPKWFSPCFFLYICTMIPPIWFLEINRINVKLGVVPINQTEGDELTSMIEKGLILKTNLNDKTDLVIRKNLLSLSIDDWAVVIEVTFLMIIIVGRWMLPKGKISRSALSQLLLVYLSLASDMIDLLSIFQEDKVIRNKGMVYSTLAIFSWSTLQFCLNLVATRGRNFHAEIDPPNQNLDHQHKKKLRQKGINPIRIFCQKLCSSELPSIFITILMQDLPFLTVRLIAVIHFKVHSYTIIFFTSKNFLILFLQFYRLWSICMEHIGYGDQNDVESLAPLPTAEPLRKPLDGQLLKLDIA